MKTYEVEIEAQVRWKTYVDGDSPEEAQGFAVEDFQLSQETNSTDVVIINSVKAKEAEGAK